jgi:hypothetical protein
MVCQGRTIRRFCELIDPAHAAYNPDYLSLLQRLAREPGQDEPALDRPGDAPSLAESLALIEQMKACPHRLPEADCGCAGLARCDLSKGREGLVNHLDCFDCLRPGRTAPVSGQAQA